MLVHSSHEFNQQDLVVNPRIFPEVRAGDTLLLIPIAIAEAAVPAAALLSHAGARAAANLKGQRQRQSAAAAAAAQAAAVAAAEGGTAQGSDDADPALAPRYPPAPPTRLGGGGGGGDSSASGAGAGAGAGSGANTAGGSTPSASASTGPAATPTANSQDVGSATALVATVRAVDAVSGNWAVSLQRGVAEIFGLAYQQVVVRPADPKAVELEFVEVSFKDQYVVVRERLTPLPCSGWLTLCVVPHSPPHAQSGTLVAAACGASGLRWWAAACTLASMSSAPGCGPK